MFLAGRELDRWKLSGFLHNKRLSRSKSLKPSDGRSQRHTGSLARPNPHSVQRDLEAARRPTCPSYRNTRDLTTIRATEATHHEARFWAVASLTGFYITSNHTDSSFFIRTCHRHRSSYVQFFFQLLFNF